MPEWAFCGLGGMVYFSLDNFVLPAKNTANSAKNAAEKSARTDRNL